MTSIKIVLLIILGAVGLVTISSWFIKDKEDIVDKVKQTNKLDDQSADNMGNMMLNVMKFLSIVSIAGFIFVLVSLIISLA